MNDQERVEETPERAIGMGVIEVSCNLLEQLDIPGLSLDNCDTRGRLREQGVFTAVHHALLLPDSYTIIAMMLANFRIWKIAVQSPDIPVVDEGEELPEVIPYYCRHADGTNELTSLKIARYSPGLSLAERLKRLA